MSEEQHRDEANEAPRGGPLHELEGSAPQRVCFVGKYGYDDSAGNSVAIRRLVEGYRARGIDARYVTATGTAGEAAFSLFGAEPELFHALHAGDTAEFAATLADAFGVPLVVTLTGTDWGPAGPGDGVLARLKRARGVVALAEYQRRELRRLAPEVPVALIPQAVVLGTEPLDLRQLLSQVIEGGIGERRIALLPGGLRPVKGQGLALDAFGHRGDELQGWFLVIAGPILDVDYAEGIRERARSMGNALYLGEIPHDAMPAAMGSADAVLNSSRSEGEPQTILEAQCVGVPVVARRIEGNEALVQTGVTGWLFDDDGGLCDRLLEISSDLDGGAPLVQAVTAAAKALAAPRLDADREVDEHLAFYRALSS